MHALNAAPIVAKKPRALTRYAVSVALTVGSVLLRLVLNPLFADRAPYITFYGSVALATWFGGAGPGLIAVLGGIGFAVVRYHVLGQDVALREGVALAAYCISCGIIVGFGSNARAAKLRLAESALALREASRRKDEFLAMLAHELRNPLAAIVSATSLLSRLPQGDPLTAQQRDVIARQAHHLKRLVDDLLDSSRLVHSRLRLECEPVDFRDFVTDAVGIVTADITRKSQILRLTMPDTPVIVFADHVRLTQIVTNLLDNATKYTQKAGIIDVSVRVEQKRAILRVRDNGTGMTDDVLASIFSPFTQAPQTIDRAEGGLGLGLSIVKQLVELHDGSVSVTSAGPSSGTTVEVQLPLSASTTAQTARPEPDAVAQCSILLVDDNVDLVGTLAALLRNMGHIVRVAYNGRVALEDARSSMPDLALVDIGLPEMDGHSVVRELRKQFGAALTIVVVSGYGSDDDRARSMDAGADAHIVKPLTLETLQTILAMPRRARTTSEPAHG